MLCDLAFFDRHDRLCGAGAPSDSFIDASLSGHLVSAANDDAVAITKSARDLHQAAEGLSDGDLAEFEPFRCVLDVDGGARAVAHDCGRGDEQHSFLIARGIWRRHFTVSM